MRKHELVKEDTQIRLICEQIVKMYPDWVHTSDYEEVFTQYIPESSYPAIGKLIESIADFGYCEYDTRRSRIKITFDPGKRLENISINENNLITWNETRKAEIEKEKKLVDTQFAEAATRQSLILEIINESKDKI